MALSAIFQMLILACFSQTINAQFCEMLVQLNHLNNN